MKYEIDFKYTNLVWTLVVPLVGVNLTRCKWVFKMKTRIDGNIHIYKSRLVAKGYKFMV